MCEKHPPDKLKDLVPRRFNEGLALSLPLEDRLGTMRLGQSKASRSGSMRGLVNSER